MPTLRVDPAHAVVQVVGDEDVTIRRHGKRAGERSLQGWPAVADMAASYSGDDPARLFDTSQAMIALVGHEDVAVGVDPQASRTAQVGIYGCTSVAGERAVTGACDGGYDTGLGVDLMDSIVGSHVKISGGVHGQSPDCCQPRV